MSSTGPSIRAVCRILNQNSCGSGSICGIQPDGKALILSNAHVAGTKLGRIVKVFVESTGDNIQARVVQAAYSDAVVSDWALLETTEPYTKVKPVFLSKKKPTGSHYTKGFPRCRPHNGTDIATQSFGSNGVWYWEPDAIGGQSGSGVWSDDDGFQYGLLTWQWGRHGAGQQTAEIYKQARAGELVGYAKPEGLKELDDTYDLEERGSDDPTVENGFFSVAALGDYPIWAEDQNQPPTEPDPPAPGDETFGSSHFVEYCREIEELHAKWRKKFDASPTTDAENNGTFGL